jgi:two-component system, NtrC family, sensor histidine kinase GlrK
MRISTRIILGFGILMLLAFAGLVYQISVIHQMQAINRELSSVNFHAASVALSTMQLAETIKEFSRKYFVDPIYEQQLNDYREEFSDDIVELQKTVRFSAEREEVDRLARAFDAYTAAFAGIKHKKGSEIDDLPPQLLDAINDVQSQSAVVYDVLKSSIEQEVALAAQTGQRAERVSTVAGSTVLLLGAVVAVIIVRAINDPLRRLTHGTRAIAKGEFWHRLPAYGSDEFSELARDFNAMTERLAELDQMKKDFVSHVSHDLKAPLASMRQVMHLLLQEIPGTLNDQQKNLLRLSYNSAERLSAMVGNLLDVSRLEAGTMEYDIGRHDFVKLVKEVASEFEVQAQQKDIHFRIEAAQNSIFVECDRNRIIQVIGNLLDNALKFSPSNSEIITRIGEAGGRPGSVLICVADSGPGIPDHHKTDIFTKFHQVKRGSKMAGQGVGLGLAICKTIVEAHHGQIWVEDNPNGGSIFSVALQAAVSEEALQCGQTV